MAKFTIEEFKNNDEYKKIVKRIFFSVLIIIPYIVLFFFLEKYDIVGQGQSNLHSATVQSLMRDNETLKQENRQLREELDLLKKTHSPQ